MNTLLDQAIEHWKRLATGNTKPGETIQAKDCALCKVYRIPGNIQPCLGCPVHTHTGKRFCANTPYVDVDKFYISQSGQYTSRKIFDMPEFQALAQIELDFLISLK